MSKTTVTKTEFHGWKSISLRTEYSELIMPLDVGPRVMSIGLIGGPNLFGTIASQMGKAGEDEWMVRGGHRLWVAPEVKPRTYELDNFPIRIEALPGDRGVVMKSEPDVCSGLQKLITIEMVNSHTFKVTHRLENALNAWTVECAPWPITVLKPGGYMVLPFPQKGEHFFDLKPNYSIIPWSYTDLTLPLWDLHSDYIGIETSKVTNAQKIGLSNYPGWSAYWQEGGTFVAFDPQVVANGNYPDCGACVEAFINDEVSELENLGEFTKIEPGAAIEHVQYWGIVPDLSKPDNDKVYKEEFRPAMDRWLNRL